MRRSTVAVLAAACALLVIPLTAGEAQAACSNETIRLEQHATWLPDCRAFELVTPGSEKEGNALALNAAFGASDGNRAMFSIVNSLPEGRTLTGGYVASRGADGWHTTYVSGTPAPDPTNMGTYVLSLTGATPNLDRLFLTTNDNFIAPEEYLAGAWTSNPLGQVNLLAPTPDNDLTEVIASSEDGSHAVIVSRNGTPFGPVPGGPVNQERPLLYDAFDGQLRLLNVDSAGNLVSKTGATIPGTGRPTATHVVSADGSRIIFQSQPSDVFEPGVGPQLYLRIDGERTVMISESHHSAPQPSVGEATSFAGASADGTKVFFTTTADLTDDATGGGPYLYEFSLPRGATSGTLRLVSTHPVAALALTDDLNQVTVSDDGSHVYYLSPDEGGSLWLYHASGPESGATERVSAGLGETVPTTTSVYLPENGTRLTESGNAAPLNPSEISPDGNHLVFTSNQQLAGSTNTGAQLYKFDDQPGAGGALSLISTAPAAPSTRFNSALVSGGASVGTFAGYEPDGLFEAEAGVLLNINRFRRAFGNWWNSMSTDGRTVFFETAAALVPNDVNGKGDVYEWHDGAVSLVSSGRSESNSYYAGASRDGSTVFFITRDDLIPARDGDGQFDFYVARVDGGIPLPVGPSCSGEACQGAAGSAPPASSPASTVIDGPGNPQPQLKPKKKHRKPKCASRAHGKAHGKAKGKKKPCGHKTKKKHSAKHTHGKRKGA